jgi:hypothetical protein
MEHNLAGSVNSGLPPEWSHKNMMSLKNTLSTAAFALLMGAGALIATTGAASARMVCNSSGDCWHTDAHYSYPGTGYGYHNDDWYFHQKWDSDHHYRESHEGRGYYKSGVWITL